jgi:phage-related minor tail protein
MSAQAMPESDRTDLTQLVQTQTGASAAEAQRRVEEFDNAIKNADAKMRAAADAARKAAAEASIYTALSMLIGAFIASVSAALGGHLRDQHP